MRKIFNKWFFVGVFIVFASMLVMLLYSLPETMRKKPATLQDLLVVGGIFWVMTVSVVVVFSPKDKD